MNASFTALNATNEAFTAPSGKMGAVLGFSTLGCPGLPLPEVVALAHRYGVDLVELRCTADEPVHSGLSAEERRAVRNTLASVRVGTLATYFRLCENDPAEIAPLAELARDLGAPALRIFAGRTPETTVELAAERLAAASQVAGDVTLLLETHDMFLRGTEIAAVLAGSGARNVGAVWDIMHTWRAGESPTEAARALGPWVGEVQVKDAASGTERRPMIPGTGTVPIRESLAALDNYTGPVVLEHETRWYADADPFEDSLAAFVALCGARNE
jgi:sugar phosphate isomerase/epimerase